MTSFDEYLMTDLMKERFATASSYQRGLFSFREDHDERCTCTVAEDRLLSGDAASWPDPRVGQDLDSPARQAMRQLMESLGPLVPFDE